MRVKELCKDTPSSRISAKTSENSDVNHRIKRGINGYFGPIIISNTANIVSSAQDVNDMQNHINKPLVLNPSRPTTGFGDFQLGNNYGMVCYRVTYNNPLVK